jgi:hypothetical protein
MSHCESPTLQGSRRPADPLAVLRPALLGSLGAALLLAAPAAAEIYKCVGDDGKTTFTSRADSCPGATLHRPKGRLQTVPSSDGPRPAPARAARPPAAAAGQQQADAARWRAKRTKAEQEKAEIAGNLEAYRRIVTGCNRGATYTVKDETGIKREFSCDEARSTYDRMQQRQAEIDGYLTGGLTDECRRAGCLPGWIR